MEGGASSEADPVVHELLNRSSLLAGAPGETTLLHFAQEQARKDVEINALRKQKVSVYILGSVFIQYCTFY